MDSVEIMLKEYETLRQESLNSMNNRNTIISFGLATVGAIFAGSVVASKDGTYSFISSLALIVAIPIINTFVLFMWLGEYERMQRAGKFIAKLEDKINEEASKTFLTSKKLLTWETYLRESQSHAKMKYPYTATIGLLIGISAVSLTLGLVEADFSATLLTGTAVIALVIAYIGLYLYVASRIAELEDKINEEASKKLLTWETQYPYTATVRVFKAWCVDKEEETQYPYTTTVGLLIGATMGVLIGISVISLALGLVQADFSATLLTGTAGIALVIAYIGLYLYVKSRIAELGDKINGEASKKPRGTHLYTATVGLLIGISVVSLAFGLVEADFSATLLKGTAVIALVIAHIELYLYVESRISRSHL